MYESSYSDGYYNGRAYFGTGGDPSTKTADLCSPHIRLETCGGQSQVPCAGEWNGDAKPANYPPMRDLTTEEGCASEALERGLTLGGDGQPFAGEWDAHGCFMYDSTHFEGYYNGMAWFGTGGNLKEKMVGLDTPYIRLGAFGEYVYNWTIWYEIELLYEYEECSTRNVALGHHSNVYGCAYLCYEAAGCEFFLYDPNDGQCLQEST